MDPIQEAATLIHSGSVPDAVTGSADGSFNLFSAIFGKPNVSTDVSISSSTQNFIWLVLGSVVLLILLKKK